MTLRRMVAGALALAAIWLVGDAAGATGYPNPAASRVAGVPVYCFWGPEDLPAAGIYDTVAKRIYLGPEACHGLRAVKRGYVVDAAVGVVLLAHETAHSRGIANERKADCFARRKAGIFARALGASWKRSQRILVEARNLVSC